MSREPIDIKIEKDIPPPAYSRKTGARHARYPFAEMEIGDSILVPYPTGTYDSKVAAAVRSSAYSFHRSHIGYSFVTQARSNGVRVWRVADPRVDPQQAADKAAREAAQTLANDIIDGALE